MRVKTDSVMPSGSRTEYLRHYRDLKMEINLQIPVQPKPGDAHTLQSQASAVADLIAQGVPTYRAIAKQLNLSVDKVTRLAKQRGMRPMRHPRLDLQAVRELRQQGMTFEEIAEALKISRYRLYTEVKAARSAPNFEKFRRIRRVHINYLKHPRLPAAQVQELLEAGSSLNKIAVSFDVSESTVRHVTDALRASGAILEKTKRKRHSADLLKIEKLHDDEILHLHK
jgi:biotin operon repressor